MTGAEASTRIDELREETGVGEHPENRKKRKA